MAVSPHVISAVGHLPFNSKSMNWYQVTFTIEEVVDFGKLTQLTGEFSKLYYSQLSPLDVALFKNKDSLETEILYFTPACGSYCPEFLARYNASPCAKPSADSTKLLIGENSANKLLL